MEGHNVSRTHFYRLQKAVMAPQMMWVRRHVLISAKGGSRAKSF